MPAKKKQQASAAEQNTTKKVKPAAVEAEPAEVNEVTQVTVAPKKIWSVAGRVDGSTTSAESIRLLKKRMRRSISRKRRLP